MDNGTGLKILRDLTGCANSGAVDALDIVAIHGMGAHPDETWCKAVDSNGNRRYVNWLEAPDMLPAAVPNARIMRYGYHSQWCGEDCVRTKASIISQRLLLALKSVRKDCFERPLIFIAHSFGGLVVLKTLIDASIEKGRWPMLFDSVVGLVFFGTPFRGAHDALSQGKILQIAAERFGSDHVHGENLKVLRAGDESLQDLVDTYLRIARQNVMPRVACFFEQKATDLGFPVNIEPHEVSHSVVLVNESSGCLDLNSTADKYGFPRNHMEINKFAHPGEEDFVILCDVLDEMAKQPPHLIKHRNQELLELSRAESHRDDEVEDRRCLRALRSIDPRDEKTRILATKDKLLKESYVWILEDPTLQGWLHGTDNRLLWIKGGPGKGKTMMMAGLIDVLSEEVKRTSSPGFVSYFFCQNTDGRLNKAVPILKGLIYMLATQEKTLIRYLRKKYDTTGEDLFLGPSALFALWNILKEMLTDCHGGKVYIMVDALDECDDPSLDQLLGLVAESETGPPGKVKWLVTSRPAPRIEKYIGPDEARSKISLELEAHNVSKGVHTFIDCKVRQLAEQKKYKQETEDEVRSYLNNNAEGTFLWVALVCKRLQGLPQWKIRGELSKLGELRRGLDPFYGRMMQLVYDENAEDAKLCMRILRTVTLAYRPLRLQQLGSTAGLPKELLDGDSPEFDGLTELVERCGSFLIIRDETVYFVHQSAMDYFGSGDGSRIFTSKRSQEHGWIAQRCLDAMLSSLKHRVFPTPESATDQIMSRDERRLLATVAYACCYWINHIIEAARDQFCWDDLADGGRAHTLFKSHFIPWIEAVGHMKEVAACIQIMKKLECLIDTKKKASPGLYARVRDSYRFLRQNRYIVEDNPTQSYFAALLFAPRSSPVRLNNQNRIPRWIRVMTPLEDSWSACLQSLVSHSGEVYAVVFSPDGSLIASGSQDGTVRLWEAATGSPRGILEGHSRWIYEVTFSPDGSLIASASDDGTIRLWEVATGSPRGVLEGHSDWVLAVAFSPDGSLIASASRDCTVILWEVATGLLFDILEGHSNSVSAVAFSPDGSLVASASYDGTVRLWKAATGLLLDVLESHSNSVLAVVFSPDGSLVASATSDDYVDSASSECTVRLWQTATGSPRGVLEGHSGSVYAVAFSPDGSLIASASEDGTIRLWEVATGSTRSVLEGHSSAVSKVVFSPDGSLIASASDDGTIRLWEVATGSPRGVLEGHSSSVSAVVFSPDGSLVASASADGTVRLWEAAIGSPRGVPDHHLKSVNAVIFSPDGSLVASISKEDGMVRLWEAATGSPRSVLKYNPYSANKVVFSPDGSLIAAASYHRASKVWETATGSLRGVFRDEGIAFSPDGSLIASYDHTVRLWEAATGSPRGVLDGHSKRVRAVVFSPDGSLVASASYDGTIRLWEVATGSTRSVLEGHSDSVSKVVFSPDGSLIASATSDDYVGSASSECTVRLWETATGSPRGVLDGHSKRVSAVVFSPDGSLIASGSQDGTIRLWEVATGSTRSVLEGHSDWVLPVTFSPDGSLIAFASGDRTVRLWDVEHQSFVQTTPVYLNASGLAFENDGKSVHTDQGTFPVYRPSLPRGPPKIGAILLSIKDDWVTWNDKRIIWLPPEYRPSTMVYRTFVARGNVLVIGHFSGRVTFISFDPAFCTGAMCGTEGEGTGNKRKMEESQTKRIKRFNARGG